MFRSRPSARAYWNAARNNPNMTVWDRLHGYAYARWCYLYIAIGTGRHPLAQVLEPLVDAAQGVAKAVGWRQAPASKGRSGTVADGYHGKAVPLAAAAKLITVQRELAVALPEQVIPYPKARDIVLTNPRSVVVLDCPCRASAPNPCLPLDVCLVIGEPFASFMLEHHPGRCRRISADEAVDILRAEDARGHAHHAFFKDAMLGRFYAICNCCPCCCGAMRAQRHGLPMLASSGYVITVDESRCRPCGKCMAACPFGALSAKGGKLVIDASACMGCGVCLGRCSKGALRLVADPSRGKPLEVETL